AIQYLALDVHQATSVGTVRDESGAIRMRATVPTEAKALVDLVKGIGRPLYVAFEEGTHAQWLHDLLRPHGSAGGPKAGRASFTPKFYESDGQGRFSSLLITF